MSAGLVLLTGASGYVGGRLLRALEAGGRSLRCMARRPEHLRSRVAAGTEVVAGDVLDPHSLDHALRGVTVLEPVEPDVEPLVVLAEPVTELLEVAQRRDCVSALAATSTMWACPSASKWVSGEVMRRRCKASAGRGAS